VRREQVAAGTDRDDLAIAHKDGAVLDVRTAHRKYVTRR
jgi:hypothetical protein